MKLKLDDLNLSTLMRKGNSPENEKISFDLFARHVDYLFFLAERDENS
jgi:hypothetical protein